MGTRAEPEAIADFEASDSVIENGSPHNSGGVPIDAGYRSTKRCAPASCKVRGHAPVCLSSNRSAGETDKLKQEKRNLEFKLECD